ncbi:MAG: DNA-binding protein [Clostridiales bacterium]|nr:DNA-binding protein [Clostridiales bacterium]
MEKDLRYSMLLQIYGKLLTEKQQEVVGLYYDYDLSLAEISENLGISRQAVLDSLRNACDSLRNYEEKLNILAKNQYLTAKIEKLKILTLEKNFEQIGKVLTELSENV